MHTRAVLLLSGLVLATVGVGRAPAQITTGKAVATDSVNLFAEPPARQAKHRSAGFAMLQSVVLPGLGQQYLGRPQRALAYYTAEVLLIFGAVLTETYSRRMYDDARTLAWIYAGARGGGGANDQYWQNVGRYLDSDGYNAVQEANRTPDGKYVEPNLQWAWVDEEHMDEYAEKRGDAANFHVASSVFLGAMVLDRLISFIDVRVLTLRAKRSGLSSIRIRPGISADLSTLAVSVSHDF